jgi:hypothetical protein
MTQMVQMLQAIPKDSPAFNVILLAMFQNSSIHNRDQIVNALMQGNQPNPEEQQMQQFHHELQMEQAKADIQKTLAEAQEEQAKAMKWQSEAMLNQPNEIDFQQKILKLQKEAIGLEKTAADIENKRSETARNIPEVDHLQSETILNLAKAREASQKVAVNSNIQ